jgi:GalNAc-alpha-(1->4)-GalNAc-alpha-(1->3)-diNAcBac-PP-undecaprenol alpha-1,4-N-acetyl-D-galactosaminyltransferase
MRITLICARLNCGGTQRVISVMANHWAQKGWAVTLLTLDEAKLPFFDLAPPIKLLPLGIYWTATNPLVKVWNNLKRVRILRRAIRDSRPEVVVSFLSFVNILVLLATRGLGLPVVISEHSDPLMDSLVWPWTWLHRFTYAFGAPAVVQTERAKACFPGSFQARIAVIPNPITHVSSVGQETPKLILARPSIAAMGRLHRSKGFDLLLKAFAILKDRHPDWTVTIFGEGPLRSELEVLRDGLGLAGRVSFPGVVRHPHAVLRQADLFALSSRWEGWPLALAEAMACGLPVVASDCRVGPREIIRDGVDGLLVPPEEPEALAYAMDRLMSDESLRKRLASRAVDVVERFSQEAVMRAWDSVIEEAVHCKK